ncbi:MAG: family 16 glycosylhydrolase [Bacteroidales bacterium]|nr:family 16 glycosylhydrolase [Bacteroidales bacterium]
MYGNQAKPNAFQVALFENNAGGNELQRYECSLSGVNLSKDYHIFTVEWSEQRLEWKINGETIATQQKDVPAQELFWSVYSVKHNEKELSLNKAYLEVDWLRAYRQKAE